MIRPVNAPVSQRFGENPTKHLPWDSWLIQTFGNYQPDGHSGQDYACDVGTPIRAVTSGTVRHIGWMAGSYAENPWWVMPSFAGYVVVIDHGAFIGIYGHCKDGSGRVKAGQRVSEGQVVALSGNTGASTGPHLHFEILPDRYILNSAMYGRIDPETLFAGTITTQSVTPKEDTLSAKEVQQIIDYQKALAYGGWMDNQGKKHPGFMLVIEENQRRITALRSVVDQLAAKQGVAIDYAKIDAIVDKSIADAGLLKASDVVDVNVNVTGR